MGATGAFRGVRRRSWRSAILAAALGGGLIGSAPRAAAEEFRCSLIEAGGVAEVDARTAAGLVCSELRRAASAQGEFDVRLAALGKVVFVTVTRVSPAGSVTARLESIEEVEAAAPRLATALVLGESFGDTQRVGNLLESETRPALAKKGSLQFLVGVSDVESAGHGARAAGFTLGMTYATPRFALPAELRFAWDTGRYPEPELDLFSLSVGGRAYLSTRDTSPFVGGGVGILRIHAREGTYPGDAQSSSPYFDAERFGVAPYLEVGVEVLRLHRARMALVVRADLPLSSLKMEELPIYSYGGDWQADPVVESFSPAQSRYIVPVSIGVSVAF